MVTKTRKLKKVSEKAMTIPQLRKSFEHIDKFVESKVLRLSEREGISEFRKEWKRTFGEISEESARDYLQFMRTKHASKKQTGGAVTVLAPASIGYDMRGGEATLSYPAYVSAGFMEPPKDSITATCGQPNAFLPPAADTGSNAWTPMTGGGGSRSRSRKDTNKSRKSMTRKKQAGGSIGTAFSEFMARPFGMGSPPTMSQDLGKLATGYNGLPSPKPEINSLPFTQQHTVFNGGINPVTRTF
jgi:hypothetical protein